MNMIESLYETEEERVAFNQRNAITTIFGDYFEYLMGRKCTINEDMPLMLMKMKDIIDVTTTDKDGKKTKSRVSIFTATVREGYIRAHKDGKLLPTKGYIDLSMSPYQDDPIRGNVMMTDEELYTEEDIIMIWEESFDIIGANEEPMWDYMEAVFRGKRLPKSPTIDILLRPIVLLAGTVSVLVGGLVGMLLG